MEKYTKEDVGNAIYGEMSIEERKEFIRYTIKALHEILKKPNCFDDWKVIKVPCMYIAYIIKKIEKEENNAKKK